MVKAENNHELRQFSSDFGRPTMAILKAALFPDAGHHHLADPADRPQFGGVRTFSNACLEPMLHLSFRKRDLSDETL